jgi:two-component system sensor histidine kinase KdpD
MVPMSPERIVVALTGGPEGEVLLRRAAGIAGRGAGGELHSVYVARPAPGGAPDPAGLARLRALTEELGGTHHALVGADPAQAVLDYARGIDATQVVVGVSRRSRLAAAVRAGVSDRLVADSGDIDVLMVSHPYARGAADSQRPSALSARRRVGGWALGLAGPVLLTAVLDATSSVPTMQALAYLALTVLVALVGGLWPAVAAAVMGSVLLNYFFTPPLHTLSVADLENVVALVLFLVVAVSVASVVDAAARRSVQADLARREADSLSRLNQALLRTRHGVDELLDLVLETFSMTAATLLRSGPDGTWTRVATRGDRPPLDPRDADVATDAGEPVMLLLRGRTLPAHDLRVLAAFVTHLAVVLDRAELAAQAAAADRLEQGNRLRTVLLAAVSHDLRTPLAGIKAAVSTLRTPDVRWTADDEEELLAAIEDSADRLGAIIANLLDLSRLQTGGVTLVPDVVGLEDVVSRAVSGLAEGDRVQLDLPDDLPAVRVDAGLLDRVVANLVDNALRHTEGDVRVDSGVTDDRAWLRVVDHGPGVPAGDRASLFEPFQRLGDAPAGEGVGLGLAVARGLTEAMGGTLTASDTPGGGLTMTVSLPAVPTPRPLHELVQP